MTTKGLHTKTRNRLARQETLREYMQQRGSVQYLFDIVEKIEKLDPESDTFTQDLAKYSKVVDVRHKMLGKYLPELKATEITGEGGGDLVINVSDFRTRNCISIRYCQGAYDRDINTFRVGTSATSGRLLSGYGYRRKEGRLCLASSGW